MGYLHNRRSVLIQFLEQFHDFPALVRMEVSCRLVCQDQLGAGNDGPRHSDELLLASGQLSRKEIFLTHQAKPVETVGDDRLALLARNIAIGERDVEILVHSKPVNQVVLLKNKSDVALVKLHPVLRTHLVHRIFEKVEFPAPGTVQHSKDTQESGLTGTRRSHYCDKLAFAHLHSDAAQNVRPRGSHLIKLLDALQLNHAFSSPQRHSPEEPSAGTNKTSRSFAHLAPSRWN